MRGRVLSFITLFLLHVACVRFAHYTSYVRAMKYVITTYLPCTAAEYIVLKDDYEYRNLQVRLSITHMRAGGGGRG